MLTLILIAATVSLDPGTKSVLAGVDWGGVIYAFAWSAIISGASLMRQRRAQAAVGAEKSSFASIIPEMILGSAFGLAFALWGPKLYPQLNNFAGVTVLSMVGGSIGAPGWGWVSRALDSYGRKRWGGDDHDAPQ